VKSNRRFISLTRTVFYLSPALLVLGSLPCLANVPTPPPAPPTPAGYCQTISSELTNDLNAFNTTLSTLWNGSKYPTVYAGNLPMADGNVGPSLSSSTHMASVVDQLVELQAMGYTGVMIQVGFPVLYAPFYSSDAQYQQYVTFYSQVAQTIHSMGMKLIIENDELLSSDTQAGWTNTAAYFSTLSWDQYVAGRATMAATVAQVMQPDYLVLAEEPDSEAAQAMQPNMNNPDMASAMIGAQIGDVQALSLPNPPKMGAGFGSWVANLTWYLSDYVALPLDYIDFHIYPVNTENGRSLIGNALTIASTAAAAGKPVAMSETWLWKMEDSEWLVLTPDQYRSREPFGFWTPQNALFLQTLQNLANYTQMLYQAPSEPDYFFAFQNYGGTPDNGGAANCMCTTDSCDQGIIVNTETSVAQTANLQSAYTPLGLINYNMLVTTPDTTAPSTPAAFTGSSISTVVNLSWGASTDDIGVAGYNIIRNGAWIANTSGTTYKDSGLATSTTYTYQVQAFDLAGNTSTPTATISLATVYTIPPTAPSSLTPVPYATQGINLAWGASQDPQGISSYQIFRGTSPSGLVQIATVHGTTLTYKDYNLTPGTTYYYGVEGTQGQYISVMSSIASATTLPLPNSPTNLVASPTSAAKINLSWSQTMPAQGLPVAGTQVYCGLTPSSLVKVGATSATSYNYNGLAASTTYYCALLATDTSGNVSSMSATVTVTTDPLPNAPTSVTATEVTSSRVSVTWSETIPAGGLPIAGYQIYRGTSPSNLVQVATRATTTYSDTTVSAGTTYYYAITAQDSGVDVSPMSAVAQITVQ
jgi:fibronectin type 3 domain-containing protein